MHMYMHMFDFVFKTLEPHFTHFIRNKFSYCIYIVLIASIVVDCVVNPVKMVSNFRKYIRYSDGTRHQISDHTDKFSIECQR